MKQKMNSLKTQLIFRILFIVGSIISINFIIAWVDGQSQQSRDFSEKNNYHLENFNHAVNSKITDLKLTVKLFSALVSTETYTGEPVFRKSIEKIDRSWSSVNRGEDSMQMIYYDSSHNYLSSWGDFGLGSSTFFNSEPEIILDPFIDRDSILELVQGISFFSCSTVCYINYARTLSSYKPNRAEGYVIIRYPILAILEEQDELLPLVTATAYKTDTKGNNFYYNNEKYLISDVLGASSQDKIIKRIFQDNITLLTENKKINNDIINFSILDIDTEIENNIKLKIIFFSKVTNSIEKLYKKNTYSFLFSVFTLFLTTLLILLILKKPMKSLTDIAGTMSIIGSGQFSRANDSLKKISKHITTDEIRAVNDITIKLTEDLEIAHAEIMTSLDYKSERYDFIQQLIDTSPVIFITYDNHQNILLCNQYTEDLLGIPREEIIGLNYIEVFNFDSKSIEGGDDRSLNTLIPDLKGNERLFSWMRTTFTSQINKQSQTICVGIDTTYRLKLENDIRFIAEHDALTGLLNRRKVDELINQYINEPRNFYLLYIDVNYFKLVNDMLGHQAGDELLIDLSNMLKKTVAEQGVVGRTGGDEFTIVFFSNNKNTTQLLCQKLINNSNSIGKALGFDGALPSNISLSIGLVAYPENASTLEELYSKADAAMYENKIQRTGSFHFYTGKEVLIEEMKVRKYWEDLIRKSVENKEVTPYYQGIHSSKDTSKICFYEVLCRIRHKGEVIPASQFIDEISQLRIIRDLDEMVLRMAIQHVSTLKDRPTLMVNFSATTISSLSNKQDLSRFLKDLDYPYNKIVIEITEQSAIKDINKTISLMKKFKKLGTRFALDDFGTGYSSLSYLRQMPFDFLKIDKSFITQSTQDDKNLKFMESIIDLVRGLDLKVIIEGVETSDILNLVHGLDAEYLQGYYLSEPQQEI